MNKKTINEKLVLSIVLGVLIVISAVQALQLNKFKETLSEEGFSVKTTNNKAPAPTSAKSNGGSGSLPASIKDLPTMVGGC